MIGTQPVVEAANSRTLSSQRLGKCRSA